jgi:hypothetical protein
MIGRVGGPACLSGSFRITVKAQPERQVIPGGYFLPRSPIDKIRANKAQIPNAKTHTTAGRPMRSEAAMAWEEIQYLNRLW